MTGPGLTDRLRQTWAKASAKSKETCFFLLLAVVTWIIGRYMLIGPYTKDNDLVTNVLCGLFLVQTIGLYYLIGRWFFPRYVYTGKVLTSIAFFALCFLFIYWINYLAFGALAPFSDITTVDGGETWIIRIWGLLIEAGWMGCFTNGIIAYWNFGFSFEVVLIYLAIKIFRDILSSRENKRRLEKENIELELQFLKSQINPHFLFNTLNSIYSRTVDVNEEASELVLKLAELMRYGLYRTGEERVLLADELRYIQNYIDLERYRHSKTVAISFDADDSTKDYRIPPLLLIPLVENAFKHGIKASSNKASFVRISAVIEDSTLYFSVENSLDGPPKRNVLPNQRKTDSGVGLATLRRRLALLYPVAHHFTAGVSGNCFEVMLRIPLEPAIPS